MGKRKNHYRAWLHHNDAFDPTIDSIVRVEAGRLRAKLRERYSGPTKDDAVWIEMPRGKYAVNFQFRKNLRNDKSIAERVSAISIIESARNIFCKC